MEHEQFFVLRIFFILLWENTQRIIRYDFYQTFAIPCQTAHFAAHIFHVHCYGNFISPNFFSVMF